MRPVFSQYGTKMRDENGCYCWRGAASQEGRSDGISHYQYWCNVVHTYYLLPTTYYLQPTTYNLLPTTYYLLPTTYYLLPTTYYLLPTTYYLLPTTYYLLPTTYYLLPTTYYLLPTTYYLLPTTYYLLPTTYYLLPTTYYLLPTTYYLLPTTYYLLPTTYYLLPTTYYLLPTTYYLLPTTYYLLPTTYYLLPTTYYLSIGSVWVYKVKRGADGEIVKFKARICARRDQQIADVDFSEIFAPTVRYTTLRVLLALAAYYSLEVLQFDVCTAFLNATLDSPTFMTQPEGYVKFAPDGSRLVCKLKKAIYGCRQSPRAWNQLVTSWLVDYGWTQSKVDPGAYTIIVVRSVWYILAVYVDDCILVGRDGPFLSQFIKEFGTRFKIEFLGPAAWLLGCSIVRVRVYGTTFCGRMYLDMLDLCL